MTRSFGAYCCCGAAITATGRTPDAVDEWNVIAEAWRKHHQGEGHGETDARGARNARRRAERAMCAVACPVPTLAGRS